MHSIKEYTWLLITLSGTTGLPKGSPITSHQRFIFILINSASYHSVSWKHYLLLEAENCTYQKVIKAQ